MTLALLALSIDCADAEKLAGFWSAGLAAICGQHGYGWLWAGGATFAGPAWLLAFAWWPVQVGWHAQQAAGRREQQVGLALSGGSEPRKRRIAVPQRPTRPATHRSGCDPGAS
jgi:hypothetical protein